MKRTIIATAIATALFAASAAQATVVYQKDGTKIDIDGRAHFEIDKQKYKRTDLKDVGSRLRVRAYQDIGGGFEAMGAIELRFSNNDTIGSNLRTHRLFAGVTHKEIGSLTFGRQLHLGDHVPKANYTYEWGGNIFFDGHKKVAHFMSVPFAGVRVAADYYFGTSNKDSAAGHLSSGNTAWDEGQGYGVGLYYDNQFGDFKVRFGSSYSEVTQSNTGLEADEYKLKRGGIGFDVKYNDLVTLGFDWAYGRVSNGQDSANIGFQKITGTPAGVRFNKNDRFLVGAKVDVTKQNAVYAQYYFSNGKTNIAGDEKYKMNGWMIGADHKFNKFVSTYIEGGTGRVKHAGETVLKNHKLLVGTRILF